VLVSFPDPRLQTCLQQVCNVLAMSGQQIVNGISQSLTDRVKNSLQLGLFIIMVGAVLATNCKDTSNHLIVCWTNLVMHTVVMKHCSQTQGYSFPAPRLLIPSPRAVLIPSPRGVQTYLMPRPQATDVTLITSRILILHDKPGFRCLSLVQSCESVTITDCRALAIKCSIQEARQFSFCWLG